MSTYFSLSEISELREEGAWSELPPIKGCEDHFRRQQKQLFSFYNHSKSVSAWNNSMCHQCHEMVSFRLWGLKIAQRHRKFRQECVSHGIRVTRKVVSGEPLITARLINGVWQKLL
jgi:hypothetical protein